MMVLQNTLLLSYYYPHTIVLPVAAAVADNPLLSPSDVGLRMLTLLPAGASSGSMFFVDTTSL